MRKMRKVKKITKNRKYKYGGVITKKTMLTPIEEEEEPTTEFQNVREQMKSKLENPSLRQSNMLNAICNYNTRGACLDFGVYREQIKTFFDNYLLSSPYAKKLKRIGNSSANGFIIQIEYEKENYNSHAVIKCNQNNESDNLLYEYYVGRNFINDFVPIFPCFVETYEQLYFFDDVNNFEFAESIDRTEMIIDDNVRQHFREVKNTESIMNPLGIFANNACKFGRKNQVAIMLQHYDNFIPLFKYGTIPNSSDMYDIPNILLQVYFVLGALKDEYTHYDLHSENVFLYKPYLGDKYIEMTYHYNDGTSTIFPTEYIVKIIDYGTNYFYNKKTSISSQDLFDKFCLNCESNCFSYTTKKNGLIDLDPCGEKTAGIVSKEYLKAKGSLDFISPNKRNMSHDLRLIKQMTGREDYKLLNNTIISLSGSNVNPIIYNKEFGTEENTNSIPNSILNVFDASIFLKQNVNRWNFQKLYGWKTKTLSPIDKYNKYASPKWTKMGEIHVYEDRRPYEFIPSMYE